MVGYMVGWKNGKIFNCLDHWMAGYLNEKKNDMSIERRRNEIM